MWYQIASGRRRFVYILCMKEHDKQISDNMLTIRAKGRTVENHALYDHYQMNMYIRNCDMGKDTCTYCLEYARSLSTPHTPECSCTWCTQLYSHTIHKDSHSNPIFFRSKKNFTGCKTIRATYKKIFGDDNSKQKPEPPPPTPPSIKPSQTHRTTQIQQYEPLPPTPPPYIKKPSIQKPLRNIHRPPPSN